MIIDIRTRYSKWNDIDSYAEIMNKLSIFKLKSVFSTLQFLKTLQISNFVANLLNYKHKPYNCQFFTIQGVVLHLKHNYILQLKELVCVHTDFKTSYLEKLGLCSPFPPTAFLRSEVFCKGFWVEYLIPCSRLNPYFFLNFYPNLVFFVLS